MLQLCAHDAADSNKICSMKSVGIALHEKAKPGPGVDSLKFLGMSCHGFKMHDGGVELTFDDSPWKLILLLDFISSDMTYV